MNTRAGLFTPNGQVTLDAIVCAVRLFNERPEAVAGLHRLYGLSFPDAYTVHLEIAIATRIESVTLELRR